MQQIINNLSESIKRDKESLSEIERQIEEIEKVGMHQLRISTIDQLWKSLEFFAKSISDMQQLVDSLRIKLERSK